MINSEKGLSLVEVLASIVIITLVFVSVLTLFGITAKRNAQTEEVMDATFIAQKKIEEVYKCSEEELYTSCIQCFNSYFYNQ